MLTKHKLRALLSVGLYYLFRFQMHDYYSFKYGFVQLIFLQCEVVYSIYFSLPLIKINLYLLKFYMLSLSNSTHNRTEIVYVRGFIFCIISLIPQMLETSWNIYISHVVAAFKCLLSLLLLLIRFTTYWTVRRSNAAGREFLRNCPNRTCDQHILLYN